MLLIDKDGWIIDQRVSVEKRPILNAGKMTEIVGIIVHQTGARTKESTLNSYLNKGANGAHFLIDKDGKAYQTGSIYWKQRHVGKLKARCVLEKTCTPLDPKNLARMSPTATNRHEMTKSAPQRYPSNSDSIGIELVGGTVGNTADPPYEIVTEAQNATLRWLIAQLEENFQVPTTEVFRHPTVSRKDPHEAESARW